jgi:hypothetical protein
MSFVLCALIFVAGDNKAQRTKHKVQSSRSFMTPKEIAAQYEAKVFDSPDAAKVAGFVLGESMAPRNVWNKASAASAIVLNLLNKKESGEAEEIGLVIEPWSVTGCYKPQSAETPAA